MPTTPKFALRYPASADPADVPADMQKLALDVDNQLGGSGALSPTPPGSPVDGQLWAMLADATNGVVWMFRYRAASGSAFKWEFVGGGSLRHEIATSETTTSTTYVDLATVGPTITVPRAGDYQLTLGVRGDVSGSANQGLAAPKLGSAAPLDVDGVSVLYDGGNTAVRSTSVARSEVRTLAASDVVKLQYRSSTATGSSFYNRFLFAQPVRVS